MDYEKDVFIDESALDIEWLEQPVLMLRYTKYVAKLKKRLAKQEVLLGLVRADLDKTIRKDPDSFGLAKITNEGIFQVIQRQDEYKDAASIVIDLKYEAEVARGAVAAIEQRKAALENLVKLFGQQYFAGPSVPRDLSREWEQREKQKKADSKVAKRMKRKGK